MQQSISPTRVHLPLSVLASPHPHERKQLSQVLPTTLQKCFFMQKQVNVEYSHMCSGDLQNIPHRCRNGLLITGSMEFHCAFSLSSPLWEGSWVASSLAVTNGITEELGAHISSDSRDL